MFGQKVRNTPVEGVPVMKIIREIAAILVATALLALGACSFEPKTYKPTDDSCFVYSLNEDGESYSVAAAEGATLPQTVYLPVEHDGKTVSAVAAEGFKGLAITKVVIPANIKTLGTKAFAESASLQEAYFYKGITAVGDFAFENCAALKKLDLPESVKTLGSGAFKGCTGIEKVVLPYSATSVGDACFIYCSSLKKVTVRKNVENIGANAFYGCSEEIKFEVAAANEKYTTNEDYSAIIERAK